MKGPRVGKAMGVQGLLAEGQVGPRFTPEGGWGGTASLKVGTHPGPATHMQKGGRMIVLQIKKMTPFTDIY